MRKFTVPRFHTQTDRLTNSPPATPLPPPKIFFFAGPHTFKMPERALFQNCDFTKKCQFYPVSSWKITGWGNLFFIFKKIWLYFVQKGSIYFSIRSMIFWIYDPMPIYQEKMDLRSDHDSQKRGSRSKRISLYVKKILHYFLSNILQRKKS